MTPNDVIDDILRREGSRFTNRPVDRGGPTKHGVTLNTLADWRGHRVTATDVESLSETEAREIYRELYMIRPGFLGIENEAIRAHAIDCAVNHGVREATKLLQVAARVFPDGIFGQKSREAVNRMTAAVLYRRLCAARVRLYGAIVTNDPEAIRAKVAGWDLQAENAKGWANRIAEFIEGSA